MLKFEIVTCIQPFNEHFEVGKLYKAFPNKRGIMTVFNGEYSYLIRPQHELVITDTPYYLTYFQPVAQKMLPNIKSCKAYVSKNIDELLLELK